MNTIDLNLCKLFVSDGNNYIEANIDSIEWKKARKKPVIIYAIQMGVAFQVETLEGTMSGKAGDFLIKGIKGELYPCNRDIFVASYDPVYETY